MLCSADFALLAPRTRRVLALGSKPLEGEEAAARALTRSEAERGLTFRGFLVLHCPPKPESAAVLEALRASSHALQMITGDQLLTACQAAPIPPHISPYLPHISLYLRCISPHISLYLAYISATSPHRARLRAHPPCYPEP